MHYGEQITLKSLIDAQALTAGEKLLLKGCDTGKLVELDPDRPDAATNDNTIRAGLIRYLLLGGCKAATPHAKGVQVAGAYVTGELDLNGCVSALTLGVVNSQFENTPDLTDCELGHLWLDGSCLPGIQAQRMQVARNVFLRDGFSAKGLVDLNGAKIGGQLGCIKATFDGDGGPAMMAHGLDVVGDVFLRDGFAAKGLIDLNGSKIGGQLGCVGATLDGDGGPAMMAQRLDVAGDVFLRDDFSAKGLVDLNGAKIGGQLSCIGATLDGNGGPAMMAHGLDVVGSVFLRDGFSAKGLVDLAGSKIGGQLGCDGATFDGDGSSAMMAQRLDVAGDVFLRDDFSAKGLVDLAGSKIGGQLVCNKGEFAGGLSLQEVAVTGWLVWVNIIGRVERLKLRDASVGALVDDKESWDKTDRYDLRGFQYHSVIYPQTVQRRISWLDRSTSPDIPLSAVRRTQGAIPQDTDPQPYTQLARHYDKVGHRRD
ncbi:MAG: hypothetical protein KUG69_14715, partial [Marinosulfonomonas sp.]|nr:hypothetical protein [Marinosulfonomonas sp.]